MCPSDQLRDHTPSQEGRPHQTRLKALVISVGSGGSTPDWPGLNPIRGQMKELKTVTPGKPWNF